MYEVELKFPLPDPTAFVIEVLARGAGGPEMLEQCDRYFNHPARDFATTDEAFRVRTSGTQQMVTYKGPLLDSRTKTRREIEIPLGGENAPEQFAQMLELLGFRPVRAVRKRRTKYSLLWQGREFEIAVDEVAELGTFVEVETLADEASRPAALEAILALVSQFQLPPPERRSYLTLLLEKDRQKS